MLNVIRKLVNGKRKFAKRKNFRKKPRQYKMMRKINYQYSQAMQTMGPGFTIKNFEKVFSVEPATNVIWPLSAMGNDDDFDSTCRQFRYVKFLSACLTQNDINLVNEQNDVLVRVAWSGNLEQQEDITLDDATKILPNVGRKVFLFKPPDAQITLYNPSSKIVNLSEFISTSNLEDVDDQKFKIPGDLQVYNSTGSIRRLRFTIRALFRGSKVIDKQEEAKRVLKTEMEELKKLKEEKENEWQNLKNEIEKEFKKEKRKKKKNKEKQKPVVEEEKEERKEEEEKEEI